MILSVLEQYELSDAIMRTICEIGKVSFFQLTSPKKTEHLNTLRGLYCLICRDYCIHPKLAAKLLCRSRQNIINQTRKYRGYLQTKDPRTITIYTQIMNKLNILKDAK